MRGCHAPCWKALGYILYVYLYPVVPAIAQHNVLSTYITGLHFSLAETQQPDKKCLACSSRGPKLSTPPSNVYNCHGAGLSSTWGLVQCMSAVIRDKHLWFCSDSRQPRWENGPRHLSSAWFTSCVHCGGRCKACQSPTRLSQSY